VKNSWYKWNEKMTIGKWLFEGRFSWDIRWAIACWKSIGILEVCRDKKKKKKKNFFLFFFFVGDVFLIIFYLHKTRSKAFLNLIRNFLFLPDKKKKKKKNFFFFFFWVGQGLKKSKEGKSQIFPTGNLKSCLRVSVLCHPLSLRLMWKTTLLEGEFGWGGTLCKR
jgi:hypothetical protein